MTTDDDETPDDDLTGMYDHSAETELDDTAIPSEESGSNELSDAPEDGDTSGSDSDDGAPSSGPGKGEDLVEMYEQPPGADGDEEELSVQVDTPIGEHESEPETATGTFYVNYATDASVTLHDVDTAQIFTLTENPGFEDHDIVEASLVAQPPMEVSYLVDDLKAHYTVPVETSPEPPTRQVQEIAAEMEPMEAVAIEREGEGEIHVLRVDPDAVEQTTTELHEDEMTHKNAARYGVERVEIRTDKSGIVSVRYLP
jgi:cell division septation protein DedD